MGTRRLPKLTGGVGYVTVGSAVHRRSVPLIPDMSWLGDPPSARMAARYEAERLIVLTRESVALARELDGYDGRRKAEIIAELNAVNSELARVRGAA